MATLRDAFQAWVEADPVVQAQLTGGIFDASEMDYGGESASQAPREPEPDGVTIIPHAVIRWRGSGEYPPYRVGSERETVEVYVYQDTDYSIIDAVVNSLRLRQHNDGFGTYLEADDRALAHLNFAQISGEIPAEELGYTPCRFIRFYFIQVRK